MWQLTDEQKALREEIREVVREQIQPRAREIDENCEYPRDLYEVMSEAGLLNLSIPKAYGGRCESDVSWCAYVEELAKVSGTVSLMAAYVKLVSLPIMLAGNEEQKQRVIPPLVRGERLGSFALTEPAVGSDPGALETRAERSGDGWVLNGQKRFIGNAGLSDDYVVFARTGDNGAKGISAFIVDGSSPGITVEKMRTMGMPGWQLGAPRFEDVEVPEENLLGREGDGFRIAMATFDRSRPTVAAQAVGLGQGAIELASDYAMRRHAFGRPLFDHQGIQFKLARARGGRRRGPRAHLRGGVDDRQRRPGALQDRVDGEARRLRHRDARDHRGGPGAGRQRLPARLPGRADDARRQGAADLRGRERDPAARDRAPDGQGGGGARAAVRRVHAGLRGTSTPARAPTTGRSRRRRSARSA